MQYTIQVTDGRRTVMLGKNHISKHAYWRTRAEARGLAEELLRAAYGRKRKRSIGVFIWAV